MNKLSIPTVVALSFCLSIGVVPSLMRIVYAQIAQPSKDQGAGASSPASSPSSPYSAPCKFVVKHCDKDFTASAGVIYIVDKPKVTCTLASAFNASGREIIAIPNFSPGMLQLSSMGITFKTAPGENIFYNGINYKEFRGGFRPGSGHATRILSDGKDWYFL
jgi:hypothetical protein